MMSQSLTPHSTLRQYLALTKPKVTQLAVFCAVIGMFLASPGLPDPGTVLAATVGIWMLAAAAFALNCLIERELDARMLRTARRGTASGTISSNQALVFSMLLGSAGILILRYGVNPLTMWLTLATFIGYAVVYTVILKPLTPQNIVIGGLAGAMPPALGWAAIANQVPAQAWLLVLIIFIWTPPHFWSLALYRRHDYKEAGLPMLPLTHGQHFTCLHIVLYSYVLLAASVLPYIILMNGLLYLSAALALGLRFIFLAHQLYKDYSDTLARKLFRYSIVYLALLFGALLLDHWLNPLL
ncbi:heme o synthase [Alcaligenes endophyticus]